jgi:hypothetical protein
VLLDYPPIQADSRGFGRSNDACAQTPSLGVRLSDGADVDLLGDHAGRHYTTAFRVATSRK